MPIIVAGTADSSPVVTGPIFEVVTVAEVMAHLRLSNVSATQLLQLQTFMDAATAVVEFYIGDVVNRTYTETHDGGDVSLYLRNTPVLSVDSLRETQGTVSYTLTDQPIGASVDSYGFTLESARVGRVVRRGASGFAWRFLPGVGNVTVTYTSGADAVPAVAKLAALVIVEHLWETQRGAGPRPPSSDGGEASVPGTYYAIPNAAVQLLQVNGQDPVIA